jgi:ribosomal protein S18 acetylase RimI-like enzyme
MTLRAAEKSDLSKVLSWVTSEWELRMWAGPNVRYPAAPESAWSDIEASENNAYTLVDAEDVIIGFGQVLPRDDNVLHLARLIVDSELRGQGIGRDLCIALMNMGASKYHAEYFTLNVYESNKAAVRLYQSLGFDVKGCDALDVVAMIKPLTKASTRTGFSAAAPKPAG